MFKPDKFMVVLVTTHIVEKKNLGSKYKGFILLDLWLDFVDITTSNSIYMIAGNKGNTPIC